MGLNEKIETILYQILDECRKLEKEKNGEGFKYLDSLYNDKTINIPFEVYNGLTIAIANLDKEVIFEITRPHKFNFKLK